MPPPPPPAKLLTRDQGVVPLSTPGPALLQPELQPGSSGGVHVQGGGCAAAGAGGAELAPPPPAPPLPPRPNPVAVTHIGLQVRVCVGGGRGATGILVVGGGRGWDDGLPPTLLILYTADPHPSADMRDYQAWASEVTCTWLLVA